jgi:hypothetical protein
MARPEAGNTLDESLSDSWAHEGYIVVHGIYDRNRLDALRPLCEKILSQWRVENPEKGEPGGGPDSYVMRHLNHSGYFQESPTGLVEILEAASARSVLDPVSEILGEEPLFRCTSLFFNPQETSQDGNWHRDSQFRAKDDADEQAIMQNRAHPATGVQLQIALEPSNDVEFVPASHTRWDTPEEYHIRKADEFANNRSSEMPGAIRIALEPGDAVAFNPMGLHRGRYHTDKLRRTLMLTYTATSAPSFDYFSDQPWFITDGYLDGLSPDASAFYGAFVDAYKNDWQKVQNS